jgi:hypothetical protein
MQVLDGICDLIVKGSYEFEDFDVETVNEHLKHYYKPKAVRATEKRQRQASKVKRHEVAKHAVTTRWDKQKEFLAAPTPKEKAKAKVEKSEVEVPDLV